MPRKSISTQIQAEILVKSRRRCCICFGLNRNTGLKGGQIAHLDRNSSNNTPENLAFLCFDHHDEYDSITSQRKGFTAIEVKEYRRELYGHLGSAFTQTVFFGEMAIPPSDPYAGKYVLVGGLVDSAEILVTPVPDGYYSKPRYAVSGLALWGTQRSLGPNIGTIDFLGIMEDDAELRWSRRIGDETVVSVLAFDRLGGLTVKEHNWIGAYGMNVTFEGEYTRSR